MAHAHRQGDSRICGATTIVQGQTFLKVEGQLWAVNGDPNTHGAGNLITSHGWFRINGKGVIVDGDAASADSLCPVEPIHCAPSAVGFSSLIKVG